MNGLKGYACWELGGPLLGCAAAAPFVCRASTGSGFFSGGTLSGVTGPQFPLCSRKPGPTKVHWFLFLFFCEALHEVVPGGVPRSSFSGTKVMLDPEIKCFLSSVVFQQWTESTAPLFPHSNFTKVEF